MKINKIFVTEFNFTTPAYCPRTEKTESVYDSVKGTMLGRTYKMNHGVITEYVPKK